MDLGMESNKDVCFNVLISLPGHSYSSTYDTGLDTNTSYGMVVCVVGAGVRIGSEGASAPVYSSGFAIFLDSFCSEEESSIFCVH